MPSKFGGIPVDSAPASGSRFGGVPVEDDALAQANAAPITDLAPVQATYGEGDLDPTQGMGFGEKFAAGLGKSIVDTGRGLKQAGTDAALYFMEQNPAIGNLGRGGLNDQVSGKDSSLIGRLRSSLKDQQGVIDEARQIDAPLMRTGAGISGNVAGYGLQILGPAAAVRGTTAARALLPRTIGGNAAQGAVLAGTQPVATGETRGINTLAGGAFSAGGGVLARGVGAAAAKAKAAVTPQARAVYEAAKARGINLSPAQISDSRFLKWTQSMLRSVPFTGAQGRFDDQVGVFNRELAGTIGEDAPLINSQVYANAKQRQSAQFTELTARNALKVDDKLLQSLTNIAESSKVSPKISEEVEAAIDSLYSRATTGKGGVVIPGEAYQAFDSEMGQIIKSGGSAAHFLGNVQKAVRRAMDASISPEDSAAWSALRREYGNRKTLAPLVAGANDGPISPARVLGAATNSKSSKEAMASGTRGGLGELAKIGQRMKEPPSSGTTERGMVAGLMGGGAMLDPVTGGLTAVGLNLLSRGLDSGKLTQILMRQNPGMTRQAAAAVIQRASSPAGQTYLGQRPLEIDIVGGTPSSAERGRRDLQSLQSGQ